MIINLYKQHKARKQFINDCLANFKIEFEREYYCKEYRCDFNKNEKLYCNHFGIHYYDDGNIVYENRVTYNFDKEYNKRNPSLKFSVKNARGMQDKVVDTIMAYLKNVVEKNNPEYEFFIQWTLIDARTDYEVLCCHRGMTPKSKIYC